MLFLILRIMNKSTAHRILGVVTLILLLIACSCNATNSSDPLENAENVNTASLPTSVFEGIEYDLMEIPLPGEFASAQMEYSGLTWYEQELILLPQYPNGIKGDQKGFLYAISADNLYNHIEDTEQDVKVRPITFDDAGLSDRLAGFEGFEAIIFIDDSVYLNIETHGGNPMKAFVVKGEIETTNNQISSIVLDGSSLVELPVQNRNQNASYEALTTDGQYIYAFYEQNGIEQNQSPFAIRLDANLKNYQEIPIDAINYRLTDATYMDQDSVFWAINYFFPGDRHLAVEEDPLSAQYGLGESHLLYEPLERIVKFQLTQEGFILLHEAPLYLNLLEENEARNWEGLEKFGNLGFLLVTDKFPNSILGFLRLK